jgi:serine/threonine-protein phosphatase 2A catalytic subunit
MTEKGDDFI